MLYLSPGLETLELLEGLANHCPLHLLEDQVFLGFQGHLGHLLDKHRETKKKNLWEFLLKDSVRSTNSVATDTASKGFKAISSKAVSPS